MASCCFLSVCFASVLRYHARQKEILSITSKSSVRYLRKKKKAYRIMGRAVHTCIWLEAGHVNRFIVKILLLCTGDMKSSRALSFCTLDRGPLTGRTKEAFLSCVCIPVLVNFQSSYSCFYNFSSSFVISSITRIIRMNKRKKVQVSISTLV